MKIQIKIEGYKRQPLYWFKRTKTYTEDGKFMKEGIVVIEEELSNI